MNEPQKTPLTDARVFRSGDYNGYRGELVVPADFARALESRLNRLREALEVIEYTSRSTTSSRRILRDLIQAALKADDEAKAKQEKL